MSNRVVITGIGVGSPHGFSREAVFARLLAGESAVRGVDRFDPSQHPCRIAAMLPEIPCPPELDEGDFRSRHALERLTLFCATEALRDAGLEPGRDRSGVGIILGNAAEWMWNWEEYAWTRQPEIPCGTDAERPALADLLREKLRLRGPGTTFSTACASGNFALAQARRWLLEGWADVCLAGAAEIGLTQLTLAGFGNLRALSRRDDDPKRASRPFDRDRDGFVPGEGGVLFVLEREEDAIRRGAGIYGEFAGCGLSSDAFHPVMPCPDPSWTARAIRQALDDAGVRPEQVGYINAHGTSTPAGDVAETRALHTVFGEGIRSIPVSSTKSMTGHLLTAASALEAMICLEVLRTGKIPPTINLENPDPECDLDHVANTARERPVEVVISNSFGFGGSNSCAVFRKTQSTRH
jgi:3-oxoacyl-[acyl-carrier-protein] synthase II